MGWLDLVILLFIYEFNIKMLVIFCNGGLVCDFIIGEILYKSNIELDLIYMVLEMFELLDVNYYIYIMEWIFGLINIGKIVFFNELNKILLENE